MEVLFLCGIFDEFNTETVVSNAKAPVEFSTNIFQQKMVDGFEKCGVDFEVLSAPFIGAFPNASRQMFFNGFEKIPAKYTYVKFNNVWGYRNISRASALKKAIKSFAEKEGEKLIIVYSAHTPFLEAAVYAKSLDKNIKICLVVLDLPQYMNLKTDRSKLYDVAKKYDIKKMHKLMEHVDSYVLLTEQMKEMLPIGDKPYIVREGIVTDSQLERKDYQPTKDKYIVYTGKMDEKFGVKNLVDAFKYIEEDVYLVLCGTGDSDEYIKAAAKDSRIIAFGQVTPDIAREWQDKAAVLVNPRMNNEEYTKYSFPSKNIEYLLTGKPVVAYMLDGMPEEYRKYIDVVEENDNHPKEIAKAINLGLEKVKSSANENAFTIYARKKLINSQIIQEILEL